ncbi:MAG TPA: MarR family winged helix-turn-helix transcriptional regulator [Terriglobia bacterium]|nr:MarR family winged helix-turn-helix transcriptional regulator [Terriglobia bacterium]
MPLPAKTENSTRAGAAAADLPLPTLLSQALVAFTIEFDNEFERQMPHRTTNLRSAAGSRQGPWLGSLAMWSNCMKFVGKDGVRVGELEDLARTKTNLNGMERWGYIVVEPDPADTRPKPPPRDWVVRATAGGRRAQEVWRPLFGVIEKRWQARFGEDELGRLREALRALISRFDVELPECLPILGYGLFSRLPDDKRRAHAGRKSGIASGLPLPALLAQALLAFAIEFERESDLSLAICANVVRVLDEKGVRVRDLPFLTGVSKEAISMAMGFLQKRRLAAVEPDPTAARTKLARLTPEGREAQDAYRELLGAIEERWQARFGKDAIRDLREPLERLVGEPTAELSPLFKGLEPYPDGWRASVRKPGTLPHYPMVLHRGGYPDGS